MTVIQMKNTRIALVTGASQGIGREIAFRLADVVSGVAIHFHDRRDLAEKVVLRIRKKGKLSTAFKADLTQENQALSLIQKVEERFGRIDILVNNFGPFLIKPWEKLDGEDWEAMFKGNLVSAFFCLKAVIPGMRRRKWGRVINIGYSRAEQIVAFPNITPYAIAKTGLLILTRTAAAAEASSGITVNMVSPGLMRGGMLPRFQKFPKKKLGKFRDIAEAVIFLISEEAKAITGTNLVVSGTWKM